MDTAYVIKFEASQPLTEAQIKFVKESLDAALQNLPGVDKEDFLDIPEYTTTAELTVVVVAP